MSRIDVNNPEHLTAWKVGALLDDLEDLLKHFRARSESYAADAARWEGKSEELASTYEGKATAFRVAASELEELLK